MKHMTKIGAILATGLALTAMTLPAKAEMTLSFTDNSANRGTRAEATMWFADELAKRTNGEINIDFHWGGTLFKGPDALKGVGDGAADMGLVIGVYNPALNPALVLADIPAELNDPWAASRAFYELNTTHPVLQKEWDDANVKFLTTLSTGPLQMLCKDKAITTVDGFKGTKMKGISHYSKVAQDFGANVVKMTAYDTYQGLDTGLIDCALFYTFAIPGYKLPEVTTDLTLINWGALMGIGIVINKDVFETLSPEHQEIMTQLGSEYVDKISEMMKTEDKEIIKALRADENMNVHEMSDEEREKLLAAGEKYLDEWKARVGQVGIDGDELSDTYNALLIKWHDKLGADGYPWEK